MSARLQAGFSLGVVLVLSTAVVTLLSLVTANWVWGLTREQRLESSQGSRRLAEGCLQLAIARLIQNPFLSPDKLPLVELKLDSYSQGRGVVVFDKDEAERLKVPLSLNNLTSQDSRPGWGTTVV